MSQDPNLLRASVSDEELACMQEQVKGLDPRQLLRHIRLFNAAALETKTSFLPQLSLELAFVESLTDEPTAPPSPALMGKQAPRPPRGDGGLAQPKAQAPTVETAVPAQPVPRPTPPVTKQPVMTRETSPELAAPPVAPTAAGDLSLAMLQDSWREILIQLRQVDRMAQGLMNSVNLVGVEGNEVIVEAPSDLLKGRIEQPSIKSHVEPCISQVMGTLVRLRCVVEGEYRPGAQPAPPATSMEVEAKEGSQEHPPREPTSTLDKPPPAHPRRGGTSSSDAAELQNDPVVKDLVGLGGKIREIET